MVIVIRRIEGRDKSRGIHRRRFLFCLGDKIIAIVGVWVASTARGCGTTPTNGALGIEKMLAPYNTLGHFLQVVVLLDVRGVKGFILQVSAIAIDFHLIYIREASLADDILRQLMHACLAHPYLRPPACCQDGMGCIFFISCQGTGSQTSFHRRPTDRLGLDVEHKAHQYLVLVVSEHQRTERNDQRSLFAAKGHLRIYSDLRRQGYPRYAVIVGDVGNGHIHILGIFHRRCIDRVLIVVWQRFGIHKTRQHRIHLDLLRGQVIKPLCLHWQGKQQKQNHQTIFPNLHVPLLELLTHEIQHLPVFQVTFQMVVYLHRSAACRTPRIEQVARLQRKVLADVGDDFIHLVEHVAGASLLHILAIEVEMEVNRLDVAELLDIDPFPDDRRSVESLGEFPGLPLLPQLLLHLTGREVDAHGHSVIIAVGETLRDGLAQFADANHQFRLILDSSEMVGDKEWLAIVEQG